MKRSDEEEYQRFLGFPVSLWSQWRWPDGASLWHPIAWVRWRRMVRRRGPYAPDFKEFRRIRGATAGGDGPNGRAGPRGRGGISPR
jgi:hypothetical protein